ncbi:hypothetical protein SBA5_540056 [Candidatus Sulfotelmatomonas gaucii]|uniref:Uncharacterized protein n=1 Tax=Candidatus Sulfuritelmatomonas gaucii TaxID=2043161 RepID=A0A2N9LSS8_9BACT|nr:hypothetical protein SBA5_540056 [Candidatus Sulfotelmatomonas gaucii]
MFEEAAQRTIVRQSNKAGPKNGHDLPLPESAPDRAFRESSDGALRRQISFAQVGGCST